MLGSNPHKMLTSFTQSAWFHIKVIGKGERVKDFLKLITTTSPSYILMAS